MQISPTIKINFSLEFEQLRVQDTFEKITWFREHGYNPRFPGNKKISDINVAQGLDELISLVKTEYDEKYFSEVARNIESQWQWFVEHWAESPLNDTDLVFNGVYEIFLTSYGVGGSYEVPNAVVVNIRMREQDRLPNIIFHEIIHLSIEQLIQEYSIPHWYKERLVDLFYKKIFPEKSFEQNLPKEVLSVDSIFNNNFSHAEEMIQGLAKYLEKKI